MDLRQLATALCGDISGSQVLAPGPGHSAEDRSLSVKLDSKGPDGFVVHSFARFSAARLVTEALRLFAKNLSSLAPPKPSRPVRR